MAETIFFWFYGLAAAIAAVFAWFMMKDLIGERVRRHRSRRWSGSWSPSRQLSQADRARKRRTS